MVGDQYTTGEEQRNSSRKNELACDKAEMMLSSGYVWW